MSDWTRGWLRGDQMRRGPEDARVLELVTPVEVPGSAVGGLALSHGGFMVMLTVKRLGFGRGPAEPGRCTSSVQIASANLRSSLPPGSRFFAALNFSLVSEKRTPEAIRPREFLHRLGDI